MNLLKIFCIQIAEEEDDFKVKVEADTEWSDRWAFAGIESALKWKVCNP